MKKAEFLKLVGKEIDNILKYMPLMNRLRLNFVTFNPFGVGGCIYGMAYGDCHSDVAVEMIRKCTPIVVKGIGNSETYYDKPSTPKDTFSDIKRNINGKPTKSNITSTTDTSLARHFSVLENYISLKGAKNEGVIKYLRGESKELVL